MWIVDRLRKVAWWVSGAGMAGVGAVLLARRVFHLPFPQQAVFVLVLLAVALPTGLWWSWADEVLARAGWGKLRRVAAGFALLMLSPLLVLASGARGAWDACPPVVIMWVMLWHITAAVVGYGAMAAGGVGRLMAAVWDRVSGRRARDDAAKPAGRPESPALTRRHLIVKGVASLPLLVCGAGIAGGLAQAGRFRVRRIRMAAPRLPDRLRGLTITHISDLHVGRLYTPDHLPRLVEAVNDLNSDLVAITGDVVDHSIQFLPPAIEAIGQMEHRYGRFSVVGNHDLIDSPQEFVSEYGRRESGLLQDTGRLVTVGGEKIQVAGLMWSFQEYGIGRDPGHAVRATMALLGADPQCFTLALVHHPHAFDTLAARGVDVVLAGHTHGGQLMLTRPGADRPIGGGSLWFKYLWGVYRREASLLHVTAGVGNWFPVRVNAPAEIVQIQLV